MKYIRNEGYPLAFLAKLSMKNIGVYKIRRKENKFAIKKEMTACDMITFP